MASAKAPRVPERVVQAQVVKLLRTVGGRVYVLGTVRRRGDYQGTCQTAGMSDLVCFLRGRLVMIECKAQGGRLSPAQQGFRDDCVMANVDHVVGGVDSVVEYLQARGVLKTENVPHYRAG
jgi:hypothetical protein